jgi:YHS domain-containing protein
MAKDVVCGMMVDEATAQWTSEYKGQTYYFCAPGCKSAFDAEPEKYLGESSMGMDHSDHDHAHHDHPSH